HLGIELLEVRRFGPAWPAVVEPEVHQHRLAALEQFLQAELPYARRWEREVGRGLADQRSGRIGLIEPFAGSIRAAECFVRGGHFAHEIPDARPTRVPH